MAVRLLLVALLTTSCGSLPLSILGGGGGPNVAANTQIGKENRQAIFSAETGASAGRDVVTKTLDAKQVETVTINNAQVPLWMISSLIFGFILWSYLLWKLPSPDQIWRKK